MFCTFYCTNRLNWLTAVTPVADFGPIQLTSFSIERTQFIRRPRSESSMLELELESEGSLSFCFGIGLWRHRSSVEWSPRVVSGDVVTSVEIKDHSSFPRYLNRTIEDNIYKKKVHQEGTSWLVTMRAEQWLQDNRRAFW